MHPHLRRADEVDLHPLELAQEVRQRTGGSPAIEFADDGDGQAVQGAALAVDRVEIEQRLRRMLAAAAVAGVDDGDLRHPGRPAGAALLRVPQHDDVGVARDDADRVLELLALDLRRKHPRVLGGHHAPAEAVHRGLEREARAGGRFVEERGHHPVRVVAGAPARHHLLHLARAGEQLHQERHRELLGFDDVGQLHGFLSEARSKKQEARRKTCPAAVRILASGFWLLASSPFMRSPYPTMCVPASPRTASSRRS